MEQAHLFLERRQTQRVGVRNGTVLASQDLDVGLGLTQWEAEGSVHHWVEQEGLQASSLLPEALRAELPRFLEPLPPELDPSLSDWAQAFLSAASTQEVERSLRLRAVRQSVLQGQGESWRRDVRESWQVEVLAREASGATALLELSFRNSAELAQGRPGLETLLSALEERARRKAEARDFPRGVFPIVLPPGSDAGVFFHELCGHPLEGDVVHRRASFLAGRKGEVVGPAFLTVADDPTERSGGVAFSVDDEGTPAQAAFLLREGRVQEALTHQKSARALQVPSNGHARRSDFRHLTLPRMSHTVVRPHRGSLEELVAGVEEGLLVIYLTPHYVHLLSGDFCFFVPEAREIRQGKVGAYVKAGLLKGNALEALSRIEAVGSDSATFFGFKGCGKLDQGALPVSFALPTVRLGGLQWEPAP